MASAVIQFVVWMHLSQHFQKNYKPVTQVIIRVHSSHSANVEKLENNLTERLSLKQLSNTNMPNHFVNCSQVPSSMF